jgi:hypothetical protein
LDTKSGHGFFLPHPFQFTIHRNENESAISMCGKRHSILTKNGEENASVIDWKTRILELDVP